MIMKKNVIILVGLILGGLNLNATNTTNSKFENSLTGTVFARNYDNSFIFVEQGIEFAIFPDGQFDFNIQSHSSNFDAQINYSGVNFSFNSGYRYDSYVQYDDYGAVVQIESIPVFYDYYGRIVRAGNIFINYNSFGRISQVGGLVIHYNKYNVYSYSSGYVNYYNRYYVSRPWHRYYAAPIVSHCVVYTQPYRRYYTPVRHYYYGPYNNNYRPIVKYDTYRRKGNSYASKKQSDRYRKVDKQSKKSRRLAYQRPKSKKTTLNKRSSVSNTNQYRDQGARRKSSQSLSISLNQNKVKQQKRVPKKQHAKYSLAQSQSKRSSKATKSNNKKRQLKSPNENDKRKATRRGRY